MTGNWQNTFGGASVNPAQASYLALTITANTALVWSLEASQGTPVVAAELAVTASVNNLSLAMPDATQGATGIATIIYNPGSHSFTLTDTLGAQIAVIAPGIAWIISLTDNSTSAGIWLPIQLGAFTSSTSAGALAGYGLQAIATQLQSNIVTHYFNTNQFIDATYRASGIVYEGSGIAAFQLDTIANLTAGWWALFTNLGTDDLTISASTGDTINAVAQITLPAGGSGSPYSVLVVAASDRFNTFAGTPPIIPISGGGTGADNAPDALTNLGGSTVGIEIFEAANAAAVLALLGIGASAFAEVTVATSQTITTSSINNAFVCTAPLSLMLPDTTTLTKSFLFAAYAEGGAITLQPQPTDKINGGTLGANLVIPLGASLILATDAAGNWWPLFLYQTLDSIGSTQGDVLYRNATVWTVLAPGTSGQALITGGAAANPSWASVTALLDQLGATQGDILYRGASGWVVLAPGSSGQFLETLGAAANPAWASIPTTMHAQGFTATGNFTIPAAATATTVFKFKVIAGGGGGGCASGGSGTGGGGGGGGGYGEILASGFVAGQIVTITVGTGGVGAVATGANGLTGNTSKVTLLAVDFITALGGVGGTSGVAGTQTGGAAGVVTSNIAGAGLSNAGTVATAVSSSGAMGGYTASSVAIGGNGGATPYGAGGGPTPSFSGGLTAGQNGAGYGGGGAGGADGGAGGNGANGAVIVEWVL